MKKLVLALFVTFTVILSMFLHVSAAKTVTVPLDGYFDDALGDFRHYGTATITNVHEIGTIGANKQYVIDETSVITINCETGDIAVLNKDKKEYESGYYMTSSSMSSSIDDGCTLTSSFSYNGARAVNPGATVRFHKPYNNVVINMTLGKSNGFYEMTSIFLKVVNSKEANLPKATYSNSPVYVNNKKVSFKAYTINGNNYFMLRDLAYVFSGTEKQFDVTWNGKINLVSGKAYTVAGGELSSGDGTAKPYTKNQSGILVDGKPVEFEAYTIDGNNYFKLRDVCKYFDIGVIWDNSLKTIKLDSSVSYTD